MKKVHAIGGPWGVDKIEDIDDPIRAHKFMDIIEPSTFDFGGHYYIKGSWRGCFFGPDMVARCHQLEEWNEDPIYNAAKIKLHGPIPGKAEPRPTQNNPNPAPNGACTCGIYCQSLHHIVKHGEYKGGNSLMQLDLPNLTRYVESGYRTDHARIMKIWTDKPFSDDQLQKVRHDLGTEVVRVPPEFSRSTKGSTDWNGLISSSLELQRDLAVDRAFRQEHDQKTAAKSVPGGVCPKCGSNNLGLIDNVGTQWERSEYVRKGTCHNCGHSWEREVRD